ncbi:MAG TPA: FAD-dependent oxidoreductase [Candidatus Paceibacterota bacterium]|jgi:glycine/D-amino acid oxidase-like deaminating enzyme|nr:FAD-dependent oxidoreductase [Candidatus Paceibacterota bacterium]
MTTWSEFKKTKQYPKLDKNIKADVAIIGGGITGILSAYQLALAGKKVALIEKNTIASGATMATTAFITKVIDSYLAEVSSLFGKKAASQVWASGQKAIEEFEKIIKKENIECEFIRCDNYIFAGTKKQREELSREFKEYKRFQIEASWSNEAGFLGFPNHGYMTIPKQAKFHVTKFGFNLAECARRLGVSIFEHTEGLNIQEEDGYIMIETAKGKTKRNIRAKDVIISTYQPLINKKTHLKKAKYISYVFEVEVPKNLFREGLYEDTENPYHYFRIDKGEDKHAKYDRMILGGEDHKDMFGKTLTKKSFEGLERFLKKIMRRHPYKIKKRWYGPILEPSDGLPLIGEIKPHVYVATGFSGNGMTYSMISSLLLRDLILNKKNPWTEAYTPERGLFHPKRLAVKAKDYIEEFFGGAIKNISS